ALERNRHGARACAAGLGPAQSLARLPHAAGRRAAHPTSCRAAVMAAAGLRAMKETKMPASPGVVLLRRFLHDISAATTIAYGLMAAGIGGAVAATVWGLGRDVKSVLWDKLANLS